MFKTLLQTVKKLYFAMSSHQRLFILQ